MKKSLLRSFCISCLLSLPLSSLPYAGIIERDIEKDFQEEPLSSLKESPSFKIDIPEEKIDIPEGTKVYISKVRLKGCVGISEASLQKIIQSSLNKELSLKEMYEICSKIDQYYASKGFILARSFLPPQTIEQETLEIEVFEGNLGSVEVLGNKYYSSEFIKKYFQDLQGKPVQNDLFLKAILLLNDDKGLTAGTVFKKGSKLGTADVIIEVRDEKNVHANFNFNNHGKNLVTQSRLGAMLDWRNLLTYGDDFSFSQTMGLPFEALHFSHASYKIPLNKKGTSLEASYLFSKFKSQELKALKIGGRSDVGSITIKQALLRRKDLNIDLFSSFDYKQIQNSSMGYIQSFDKLRVLSLGAEFSRLSQGFFKEALVVKVAGGIPNFLKGLKTHDPRSSREGSGGKFLKVNLDYDRLQNISQDYALSFHTSLQWSPSKLALSEELYIGGDSSVRGFPLASSVGDSGYYCNLEWKGPLPFIKDYSFPYSSKRWKDVLSIGPFLDHGGVFKRKEDHNFLWGAGVASQIHLPLNLNLSIHVGFPLNDKNQTKSVFTYIKLTGKIF